MIKKILFFVAFLLVSLPGYAATYYVRDDGGTSLQCTGTTDSAYPGSGLLQACAYSHPVWAIGGPGSVGTLAAGDTLIIDNQSHVSPGTQAQYMIGYGMPNSTCSDVAAYDCILDAIPAGADSSNKTKIYGKGYGSCDSTQAPGKAQLWGTQRVYQVLTLSSNVDVQCLEITDHSACIENGPSDGTIGGYPVKCERDTYPFGTWAPTGIAAGSASDVLITNVDIHGMAARAIFDYRGGNWTVTNSNFIANAFVGWDSDGAGDDSYTGTVILDRTKIQFSGCGELYPKTLWSNWDSTVDLHHCWSQDQGGFGDGIGLGDGDPGAWIIKNSSISWNTSDGVDLLHGSGSQGSLLFSRSRAEGNAGNQFKTSVLNAYAENSIISGNCGFFAGRPFTSTKSNIGTDVNFNNCRAQGDVIAFANWANGQKLYINNSTILTNGGSAVISSGTTCNASTLLQLRNNLVYAGRDWLDDTHNNPAGGNRLSGFYYASGNDGSGGGPCGSVVADEDYNVIFGAKTSTGQCSGAHSICNSDPQFVTAPLVGPVNYMIDSSSANKFSIKTTSPAAGLGLTSVTLQDGSADYNNVSRGASWDSSAIESGVSAGYSNGRLGGGMTVN